MNSRERQQKRYLNRKKKRNKSYDKSMEDIFEYDNLVTAYKKSITGESKNKRATAKFDDSAYFKIYDMYNTAKKDKIIKSFGLYDLHINKKGRERDIRVPHLQERIAQKCFKDNCLEEMISPSFVNGNVGNVKNKGSDLARSRVKKDLLKIYNHYGTNAYILIGDFYHYFDNIIPNEAVKIVSNNTENILIRNQTKEFLGDKETGISFGGPVPQFIAVAYPNSIDHMIKEKLGIKQFTRCVDDFYCMHNSMEYLEYCLDEIKKKTTELGIPLNEKKTKIIPISNFTFLKVRYNLLDNGKIITKVSNKKIRSIERKFEKLRKKYNNRQVTLDYINQVFISSKSYVHINGSRKQEKKIADKYNKLFGGIICTIKS